MLLSSMATQLLRLLVARSRLAQNRISVGRFQSVDWQSLTFTGERHEISLILRGPKAASALALLRDGLAEAELQLAGHFVAEISLVGERRLEDGAIEVEIEALTLSD